MAGSTEFCQRRHQPLNYDDFRANCRNVRAWEQWIDDGRMHIGECAACYSSVSYPPPANLSSAGSYRPKLPRPHLFWDEAVCAYRYRDGDERGVCQHRSTTDALDALGDDRAPTLEQLYGLGDDWGFRPIHFTDKRGRRHVLHAETYRHLGAIVGGDEESLESFQRRVVRAAGMVA